MTFWQEALVYLAAFAMSVAWLTARAADDDDWWGGTA